MVPRAVLVQRPTEYDELLARHATREQVAFFLCGRGLDPAEVERRHHTFAPRPVVAGSYLALVILAAAAHYVALLGWVVPKAGA